MNSEIYGIIKDAAAKGKYSTGNGKEIVTAYERIVELERIARAEGLLALEDEIYKLAGKDGHGESDDYIYGDLFGTKRLLASLVSLVVNGTAPEIVEQVAVSRYYASGFEEDAAVAAGIIIVGVLEIQAGENPWALKQSLLAMMPKNVENSIIADERERLEREKNSRPDIPESFFREWEFDSVRSAALDRFAQVIYFMEDAGIQRLLREIDNRLLALCLKGAQGRTRKRFFDNMSKRMAVMVYEDICYMGPIRLIDAEEAVIKVMEIISTLEERGEIVLIVNVPWFDYNNDDQADY